MKTGGHGQLGSDCTQVPHANHEVVTFDSMDLDIADYDAVAVAISRMKPDVVVNCAAYTNVDALEIHRELAWNVNVKGPENLALCLKECGGVLIHISTDYVFNGERRLSEPYVAGFGSKNPTTASRPKNSILENKRLKERDINIMPYW